MAAAKLVEVARRMSGDRCKSRDTRPHPVTPLDQEVDQLTFTKVAALPFISFIPIDSPPLTALDCGAPQHEQPLMYG